MTDSSRQVREHYAGVATAARILQMVAGEGRDIDSVSVEALFAVDQLHGRELAATREHLAKLELAPGQHLLEVGSGLGGPARYAAHIFGVEVTGVDLTPELVATATELTAHVGLGDRVRFRHADARALPLASASFDAASSLYVGMNIADKSGVLSELRRVLKPGAKLVWSEPVRTSREPPEFPLPWAVTSETSFLVTAEALESAVQAAGFRLLERLDETQSVLDYGEQRRAAAAADPKRPSSALLFGEGIAERRHNFQRALVQGQLGSVLLVAERE